MFEHTLVLLPSLTPWLSSECCFSEQEMKQTWGRAKNWKLNCSKSAKLLGEDGSARAPVPAALYPAGLKIAPEIRAEPEQMPRLAGFYPFFFLDGSQL